MRFLSVLAMVTVAFAADNAAPILKAVATIKADTQALGDQVSKFNGQLLSTPPIIAKSAQLLGDINSGANTAKKSPKLTDDEALKIANAIIDLEPVVENTINIIIAAKPKFTKLGLNPIILGNLQLDKKATDDFGAAVKSKVSDALKPVAQLYIDDLDGYFNKGIAAYK